MREFKQYQKWFTTRHKKENVEVARIIEEFKKKEIVDIKLDFQAVCDRVLSKHIARWRKNDKLGR